MDDTPKYGGRRTRPLTEAEATRVHALGEEVRAARRARERAEEARNRELRRLFLDGVGPLALARSCPSPDEKAPHMARFTVDRIVRNPEND